MASALLLIANPLQAALLVVSLLPAAVWAFFALFLLALACVALVTKAPATFDAITSRRIALLIPAHNEELLIGKVVSDLFAQEYPTDAYSVFVIADNCSDSTAKRAAESGAEVLERTNLELRGKGYALEWALEVLRSRNHPFDAVIIMDADSELSPTFLATMNGALARGCHAIQGYYGVQNVAETWRTRLMAVALALVHYTKPLGRRRLGLTIGLKGNGMCFSAEALRAVPWSGESITEDIEYTLRLAKAGIRVHFEPDAVVLAQMPVSAKQAESQRERWEGGRYGLLRRGFGLLKDGIRSRDKRIADCGLELLIPPFVELMLVPSLMIAISTVWLILSQSWEAAFSLSVWLSVLCTLIAYLGLGLTVAKVPLKTALSLMAAPFYIAWKLVLYGKMLVKGTPKGWVRTERHPSDEPSGGL